MHRRFRTASKAGLLPWAGLAGIVAAAGLTACSGSGGTANTATPPAPTATPTPSGSPGVTPSPTAVPTATPTPVVTASPTPVVTASPSPTPTATPSPTPPLLTSGCQIGSNYIDFQAGGGAYVPAPGSGTFTTQMVTPTYAALGVTSGESGTIQSLNEGTGTVALPGPFITFAGGGATDQLNATTIPAGSVGPFNFNQITPTDLDVSFEVEGNIFNTTSASNVGTFDLVFHFTYPGTEATLFSTLPVNETCYGYDNTQPFIPLGGRRGSTAAHRGRS